MRTSMALECHCGKVHQSEHLEDGGWTPWDPPCPLGVPAALAADYAKDTGEVVRISGVDSKNGYIRIQGGF